MLLLKPPVLMRSCNINNTKKLTRCIGTPHTYFAGNEINKTVPVHAICGNAHDSLATVLRVGTDDDDLNSGKSEQISKLCCSDKVCLQYV